MNIERVTAKFIRRCNSIILFITTCNGTYTHYYKKLFMLNHYEPI